MYEPRVNDYVQWSDRGVKGWIYFKDAAYLTIEINVCPKHPDDLPHGTTHRNDRTLVVCYPEHWNQLKYVSSRSSIYDEK